MSDDRTTPMQTPPGAKPKRDDAQPGQQTVAGGADLDGGMAPTINVPPGQGQGSGFARRGASPHDTPTPPPYQRPPSPFGPPGSPPVGGPGYQAPGPAQGQTMIIKGRVPPTFAWLVVVDGPDRDSIGKVHNLDPDTTVVGRAAGNQIVLADDACSSQHFRIRVEAREGQEPAFMLYDMGSRNGTFVGTRADYRDSESQTYRRELQDGDYLLVGETTLVFKRI
jgi:FHA domain